MTTEHATNALRLHLQGKSVMTLEHALATMDALDEAIQVIRQRYADRDLVRLGHIAREGMTPAQYHIAEARARAAHPEAWAGMIEPDERNAGKWNEE